MPSARQQRDIARQMKIMMTGDDAAVLHLRRKAYNEVAVVWVSRKSNL